MTKAIQFGLLFFLAGTLAFGQSAIGSTTLSGAVTSSTTMVCVASATGVVTPSLASAQLGSYLVIDAEITQVAASTLSTTCFKVKRGVLGSMADSHGSGAKVWILGQSVSTGDTSRPISAATFLAQKTFRPNKVVGTPNVYSVTPASVTGVAGKIWYSQFVIDDATIATGACVLNGATVGTDKSIVALYDKTGALLANSSTAGTTTATASAYQCIAFANPIGLTAGHYFLALQTNGTTDNFKAYGTAAMPSSYPTGSQTGTFGTLASITVTTTFTASVGPYMTLY